MKTFIAFALVVVGISALPTELQTGVSLNQQRIVTDAIASAIEDVSQDIKNAGLDPVYIQLDEGSYAFPVPVIFNAVGEIEEFLFHGLSNIIINDLSYSILTSRLRLDISLPLIETTMRKADVVVTLFGKQYPASSAGRLALRELNINVDLRVSIGIISGISVRSIDVLFKIGGIDSQLAVSVAGYDLSQSLNTFLGITVPSTLNQFDGEINELLEIVIVDIINANL